MSRNALEELLSHAESICFIGETLWATFRSRRGIKTLFAWSSGLNQQKPKPLESQRIINWCPGQFEMKFHELHIIKGYFKAKKQSEEKRLNKRIMEEYKIDLDVAKKDIRLRVRKPRSQWKDVELNGRFVPLIDLAKTVPSDEINAGPGGGKQIIQRPPKFKKPKKKEDKVDSERGRLHSRSTHGSRNDSCSSRTYDTPFDNTSA